MSDSFDPTIRKPLARAGEFELLRRMGAGGFGVVFEARHLRSGLPYALKRIDMSAEDAERYRNEALYPARIAAESLHVMGVHSFFHDGDNDVFYLVTDLVPHGDLRRFLDRERKPLPVAQGLELGIGIAKGLAAIHAQGIIHRDLKPANVLMDRKDGVWVPKITDFGLARSSRSVSLGDFATSGYASPEQIDLLSDHPLGPESDLFAFGMMLYEVVTGAKPTPAQELREYGRWLGKRQPPPPPSHVRPELAQWPQLDAILASLLEFDRSRREGSAAVVLRRLIDVREMVAGGPKVDRVPGAPSLPEPVAVRLPAPPPIPPPAPALAPPPAPAARRPVDVPRGGGHPASNALPQVLVATTAFVSLFAMVGVASTIWPIYSVLMRENGWTFEQFTAATPYLVLLAFPLFTIIAGVTSDRFGPRPLMAVGLLLVCLAPLALAAGSSIALFYVYRLFRGAGYELGGPIPSQVLLARWFDAWRGRAMGFAFMGTGLGELLGPRITSELTSQYGWPTATLVLGAVAIAIALPLIFFVRSAPTSPGALDVGAPAPALQAHGVAGGTPAGSRPGVWTDWTFPLLVIVTMCVMGAIGGTRQHLSLPLNMSGFTPDETTSVFTLLAVGVTAGSLVMGSLADFVSRKWVMLAILALIALAVPLLYLSPSVGSARGAAIVLGIGVGGSYVLIPLIAAELYGAARLGRVLGVVIAAGSVAEGLAPMGVGPLLEASGSLGAVVGALVGLAVIAALAVVLLPRAAPMLRHKLAG